MRELRLDLLEAQILARCHDTAVTRRRIVITIFAGCAVAAGFIAAAIFGVSARTIAGIAALYALVTMLERLFYGKAILGYKSLVRKLVARIGDLQRPV
jgi:hypothetical protein